RRAQRARVSRRPRCATRSTGDREPATTPAPHAIPPRQPRAAKPSRTILRGARRRARLGRARLPRLADDRARPARAGGARAAARARALPHTLATLLLGVARRLPRRARALP